LKYVNTLSLK